jgi:hypothetical protein
VVVIGLIFLLIGKVVLFRMAVLEQTRPQVILSHTVSNPILTKLYRTLIFSLREHCDVLRSLDRWFTQLRNEVVHTSAR